MGIDAEQTRDEFHMNIASYKPSEYQAAVWPRVDDVRQDDSFTPLVLCRIPGPPKSVDPMFSDFDSIEAQESAQGSVSTTGEQNVAGGKGKKVADTQGASFSFLETRDPEDVIAEQPEGTLPDGTTAEELRYEAHEGKNTPMTSGDESIVQACEDVFNDPDVERPASDPDTGSAQEDEQSKLIAEAAEKAYAQGREDTRAEVDEIKAQLEKQFSVVVEDLRLQASEGLHSCERNAVELALQVARKLVGEVVESKREYVVLIIQDALKSIVGTEITGVRVSPQDYEYLSQHKDELGGQLKGSRSWELQSDDSIRAGCVITTSAGEVDFDLDKAWSRMREKILKGPQS